MADVPPAGLSSVAIARRVVYATSETEKWRKKEIWGGRIATYRVGANDGIESESRPL